MIDSYARPSGADAKRVACAFPFQGMFCSWHHHRNQNLYCLQHEIRIHPFVKGCSPYGILSFTEVLSWKNTRPATATIIWVLDRLRANSAQLGTMRILALEGGKLPQSYELLIMDARDQKLTYDAGAQELSSRIPAYETSTEWSPYPPSPRRRKAKQSQMAWCRKKRRTMLHIRLMTAWI